MDNLAEIIEFPIKKKRGRPKGSKNKIYQPNGTEITKYDRPTLQSESKPIMGDIDNLKIYCFEIMKKVRCMDKKTQYAFVGLLNWFRVAYLDK